MRTLLVLLLSLTPALAHAGIDYKCTDANNYGAVGWLRFDFNGANGQVEIEEWSGYPPTVLVDAKIATISEGPNAGLSRIVSAPDVEEAAVATIDVPADYIQSDKFAARADVKYISPDTKKLVTLNYKFTCVRQ
jgi:hypothetical protein